MRRTVPPRHYAGTTRAFSRPRTATGLEADSAPRHYRIPATPKAHRFGPLNVPMPCRVVTGLGATGRPAIPRRGSPRSSRFRRSASTSRPAVPAATPPVARKPFSTGSSATCPPEPRPTVAGFPKNAPQVSNEATVASAASPRGHLRGTAPSALNTRPLLSGLPSANPPFIPILVNASIPEDDLIGHPFGPNRFCVPLRNHQEMQSTIGTNGRGVIQATRQGIQRNGLALHPFVLPQLANVAVESGVPMRGEFQLEDVRNTTTLKDDHVGNPLTANSRFISGFPVRLDDNTPVRKFPRQLHVKASLQAALIDDVPRIVFLPDRTPYSSELI